MKTVWFAGMAMLASSSAFAQSTIYKHVDEGGRITYSNKPMKGAIVLELEPLTTLSPPPSGMAAQAAPASPVAKAIPARLVVTEKSSTPAPLAAIAAVDPASLKPREDPRRRQLQDDLAREQKILSEARASLLREQQNPALVAAVRAAQEASDPTATQLAQLRENVDRASGRIRGLQASVAEHEKSVESLKQELADTHP